MSALLCLIAMVAAPPVPQDTDQPTVAVEKTEAKVEEKGPLKPHEITKAMHQALIDEATSKTYGERRDAINRICSYYAQMMRHEDFPEITREQWQNRLNSRLRRVKKDLEKKIERLPKESLSSDTSTKAKGAQGGGAMDRKGAQELIELITTTIDPETWDINGGKGSIFYFSNLQVLVIRQTQEVHEKIGGVTKQLKAGP